MPFAWCEQEFFYCRRLRDAISANTEGKGGDLEIQCWLFDWSYTDTYLMCGETHRTRTLEAEICERAAVRNLIFAGCHNFETFAVLSKDSYCRYVSVSAFWGICEASRILCVSSPPIFAYYSSGFGDDTKRFGYLLLKTAITEFTIMFFACFIQFVEYGADNLFLPARLLALAEDGCAFAIEEVLAPIPCEMREIIHKRRL